MWTERWLVVDMTSGKIKERRTPTRDREMFIGGRGLGVRVLSCNLRAGAGPLTPENQLILATGPLVGITPLAARVSAVTKSPLTGTILDSSVGGFFGVWLKRAGWDLVQVKGRSEEPVVLVIDESGTEMKPAGDLAGMNTGRAFDRLEALYPGSRSMVIGRAGESGVLYASAICDRHHALGRGGVGAVMGSKGLKAVVVTKSGSRPRPQDKDAFRRAKREALRLIRASPVLSGGLRVYGTAAIAGVVGYLGAMPWANFRRAGERCRAIEGEALAEDRTVKRRPCYGCPVGCKRVATRGGEEVAVPEYETLWAFGPNLENEDPDLVFEFNRICNEYGMDTITAGATIAACAEEDGPDRPEERRRLDFWLERIGEGQDEACQGSARVAPRCSMAIKGMELPGYDPGGALGQALSYATSNRGGCHLRAYMIGPEIMGKPKLIDRLSFAGKPGLVYRFQNLAAAVDSLIMCKFSSFALGDEEYATLLGAAVGQEYASEDILLAGERTYNLERLFNLREGFTKKDDTLPERTFDRVDRRRFEEALSEYYRWRGWDEEGVPGQDKLEELGIEPL
ncbi:MAG: aldehyde ferredoxin oxidoreductase family protein [Euryarchaeota archaeon]|nr:aldehyde ferredoxin oxidoreductase family protein [Euryarchaeota archaeon]